MMAKKEPIVHVKMHKDFFDKIFEPARRDLERTTGGRVSQMKITKFLAMKNARFKLPQDKIKTRLPRFKPPRTKPLRRGRRI